MILAHSVLYFFVRAGNGIFGILTLSIFAHALSPAEYGAYALAMSSSTVVCAIAFNWLSVAVGRFYPLYRDTPEIIVSSATRGFLFAALAVLIVAMLAFPFGVGFGLSYWVLFLLPALAIVHGRYNIILQIANARGAPLAYGFMTWARALIGLISGWALIVVADMGERGALLGLLIGALAVVLMCDPGWRSSRISSSAAGELAERFFSYGVPLTVTFLAMVAVDVADRFMLAWMLGITYVAPYSVAYDLVQQSIGMLLSVIFFAAFPVILRELKEKGHLAIEVRLRKLASAYFAIGIPAATGLAILADDIAIVMFGDALAYEAAKVIPWLAVAILIGGFKSYFLDIPYQLHQKTLPLGYVALGMVAVNLVANLVLIPRFGIMGCAWASIAAFLSGSLASLHFGQHLHSLSWSPTDLVKALLGSLMMAAVLSHIDLPQTLISLLLKATTGVAVYAMAATALNIGGLRSVLSQRSFR